ncbi:MAG: RNA polymerase sigma factor [Gemmatimonadota bacterium]
MDADIVSLGGLEPVVRRYLSSWEHDPDRRDDLVQDTLIQIWRHWRTFDQRSSRSTWAYRIARNVFLQAQRSDRSRVRRRVLPGALASDGTAAVLDRIEVEQLLSGLSEDEQRLIRLLYLSELTSAEVAPKVGLADSTVRCRRRALLARLRVEASQP